VIPQPGEFETRKRLCVILVAVALLTAILLPVLPSAPVISIRRAVVKQPQHEQIARRGAEAVCQSGAACGG
jgi:hypothetical protein